jgi:hypothetical protein
MNGPNPLPMAIGQATLLDRGPCRRPDPRAMLRRLAGRLVARPSGRPRHRNIPGISDLDRLIDRFEHRTCDCT